jgi:hypothetical protein
MKAYLLKEQFQQLWEYSSPGWAARFLKQLAFVAMRSKNRTHQEGGQDGSQAPTPYA